MGIAVLGGSEGFRVMPELMTRKKRLLFNGLGKEIARDNMFQPEILKKIAGREKYPKAALVLFQILSWTGLTNFYWNSMLKSNKAYGKRFDRPYAEN